MYHWTSFYFLGLIVYFICLQRWTGQDKMNERNPGWQNSILFCITNPTKILKSTIFDLKSTRPFIPPKKSKIDNIYIYIFFKIRNNILKLQGVVGLACWRSMAQMNNTYQALTTQDDLFADSDFFVTKERPLTFSSSSSWTFLWASAISIRTTPRKTSGTTFSIS